MGYVLNIFRCIGIIVILFFHEIFYYTIRLFVVASHLLLITPRFTVGVVTSDEDEVYQCSETPHVICVSFKQRRQYREQDLHHHILVFSTIPLLDGGKCHRVDSVGPENTLGMLSKNNR